MVKIKRKKFTDDLIDKVKVIEGVNSLTIEDTRNLTSGEMIIFLTDLLNIAKELESITILVEISFPVEIDHFLNKNGFRLLDHTITVHKKLDNSIARASNYLLKDLEEVSLSEFERVWSECMTGSLNVASSSDIGKQMRSVEKELGCSYKKSCMIAYEGEGSPIGIIIPHIEPGTESEGRLFYYGLLPEEREKGKSMALHQQALNILRKDFMATYYIGNTSRRNVPMLKTFENNGCRKVEENKIFKREINN